MGIGGNRDIIITNSNNPTTNPPPPTKSYSALKDKLDDNNVFGGQDNAVRARSAVLVKARKNIHLQKIRKGIIREMDEEAAALANTLAEASHRRSI